MLLNRVLNSLFYCNIFITRDVSSIRYIRESRTAFITVSADQPNLTVLNKIAEETKTRSLKAERTTKLASTRNAL